MSSENKSSVFWSIVGLATVASIAAGGYWLYKNKEKLADLQEKASKVKGNVEKWKALKSAKLDEWQEDLEDWVEDMSNRVEQKVAKVSEQVNSQIGKKVAEVQKNITGNISKNTKENSQQNAGSTAVKIDKDSEFELNSRQESIYQVIKRMQQAAMPDFVTKVAGVTTRTLRRDLTKLQKLGLIEQVGKTKDSFYRLRK